MLQITTNNKKREDEYFGWEVLGFESIQDNEYIISGDNQYEAEMIENVLIEKNCKVTNNSDTNDILKYYNLFFKDKEKVKKYNEFGLYLDYISFDKVKKVLDLFDYKVVNYDLSFFQEELKKKSDFIFQRATIIGLREDMYFDVMFEILHEIVESIRKGNKRDFCFYSRIYITYTHILFSEESFKLYINFLNLFKDGIKSFSYDFDDVIETYKYTLIERYIYFARDVSKSSYEFFLNEMKYKKEMDLQKSLEDMLVNFDISFEHFQSFMEPKLYQRTEEQYQLFEEIKKYLSDEIDEVFLESINSLLNEDIVLLCFISYTVARKLVINRWLKKNNFIETIIDTLERYNNEIIDNLEKYNPFAINRLTTLVSTVHSFKLRYNIDNKIYNDKELIYDFYKDNLKMYKESKVITTHWGSSMKLASDVIKIQMWCNYLSIDIDGLEDWYNEHIKYLERILNFMYRSDVTIFGINRPIRKDEYIQYWERGYFLLGSVAFKHRNVTNSNLAKIAARSFNEFINNFNDEEVKVAKKTEPIKYTTNIDYNYVY